MKKTLIFGLLLSAAAVVAQPKMGDRTDLEKKKEKIEAIKMAYLTEELELTVAESQAFWPVYNERQNKEHELRELQRSGFKKLISDEPSEKEVKKMLYSFADTQIAIEELRKKNLRYLVNEARELVPSVPSARMWHRKPPGIRAQLVSKTSKSLENDFVVEKFLNTLHILNAVSPGWTSALPFGRWVAEKYIISNL